MEHRTLKYLRLFIPGFIIILCLLPILLSFEGSSNIIKSYQGIFLGVYPIIAIVFGVFYHIFNFRDRLWEKALEIIHKFIKNEMITPFKSDKGLYDKLNNIVNTDTFLNIHYSFIDSNESLKRKAEQIYFNGSILTTMIDLIVILSIFEISYIILMIAIRNLFFVILAIASLLIIVISIWGKKKLLEWHLELVKKQISFYQQFNLSELEQKLKKL